MVNKKIIERNFSKYAKLYDQYATVQNSCANSLIEKVENKGFKNILDIGCGTGNYTRLLQDKFPKASIKAIDISKEMLGISKRKLNSEKVKFIVADGENFETREKFDLISSNATFQWFEDLSEALVRLKKILNKEGVIAFSLFGPLTFFELQETLKELPGQNTIIASCFNSQDKVKKVLKSLFKDIDIEDKIYKEKYNSLKELLIKIKYTGTRGNNMLQNRFWTEKTITAVEEEYKKKFKEIVSTYQVFFCKGYK